MLTREKINKYFQTVASTASMVLRFCMFKELSKQVDSHTLLINILVNYGGLHVDTDGVCHWLALMSINAFYCNDIEVFSKRLKYLCEDTRTDEKIKQINLAKKSIKGKNIAEITEEERVLIDAAAFIEISPLLTFSLRSYNGLLLPSEQVIYQEDSYKFLSLIAGKELSARGGLVRLIRYSGCYLHDVDNSELMLYFTAIKKSILTSLENDSINLPGLAFQLSSCNHSITVIFDIKKNGWIFIDINQLPPQIITDENKLAALVFNAFEFNTGNSTIFETQILVPADSLSKSKKIIETLQNNDAYKEIHSVTVEKAKLITKKFHSQWLFVAVINGDIEKVKKLIELGGDLTYVFERSDGVKLSLLDIAFIRNYTEIAEYLQKKSIDYFLTQLKYQLNLGGSAARKVSLEQLNTNLVNIAKNEISLTDRYRKMKKQFTKFFELDELLGKLNSFNIIEYYALANESYQQAGLILRADLRSDQKVEQEFDRLLQWVVKRAKVTLHEHTQNLSSFGLFWDSNLSQQEQDDIEQTLNKYAHLLH